MEEYKRKLLQHKELDSKVRSLREDVKKAKQEYDKTEDDLKALQSVGQIIGEVLKQLDDERCKITARLKSPLLPSMHFFISNHPHSSSLPSLKTSHASTDLPFITHHRVQSLSRAAAARGTS